MLLVVFRNLKIRWAQRIQHLEDGGAHFTGFGMAFERLFGEDQFIVDGDFKNAAHPGNQFPGSDEVFNGSFFQDFVRQTDGARGIISSSAVVYRDAKKCLLHRDSLLSAWIVNEILEQSYRTLRTTVHFCKLSKSCHNEQMNSGCP